MVRDNRYITYNTDDPGLPGGMLRAPGEVATVETESTVLQISPTDTNGMDALGAKFGVSSLAAKLEFSLLAVMGALGTGCRAFVPGCTGDTCIPSLSTWIRQEMRPAALTHVGKSRGWGSPTLSKVVWMTVDNKV